MSEMAEREFRALLQQVADGWNGGDPRAASECFADDAIYVEPPDVHRYVGREALYRFFRGDQPDPRSLSMTWHHMAFDPGSGVGFGEYSFSIPEGFASHGVVVVSVREGLIATWREYQYPSTLPFSAFAGDSLPAD